MRSITKSGKQILYVFFFLSVLSTIACGILYFILDNKGDFLWGILSWPLLLGFIIFVVGIENLFFVEKITEADIQKACSQQVKIDRLALCFKKLISQNKEVWFELFLDEKLSHKNGFLFDFEQYHDGGASVKIKGVKESRVFLSDIKRIAYYRESKIEAGSEPVFIDPLNDDDFIKCLKS